MLNNLLILFFIYVVFSSQALNNKGHIGFWSKILWVHKQLFFGVDIKNSIFQVSKVKNKWTMELCILWEANKHSVKIHTLLLPSHSSPAPIISSREFKCRLFGNNIARPMRPLVDCRLSTFPRQKNIAHSLTQFPGIYIHVIYHLVKSVSFLHVFSL